MSPGWSWTRFRILSNLWLRTMPSPSAASPTTEEKVDLIAPSTWQRWMVEDRDPFHGAEEHTQQHKQALRLEVGQGKEELEDDEPCAHRFLSCVQSLLWDRRVEDRHDEPNKNT